MKILTIIFCLFVSINVFGRTEDSVKTTSYVIRCVSSLEPANKPLYVVDGVIYNKNLKSINPKDIQSINVLKGETAIAVYGTAGKNGVILINMKQSWRAKHKSPAIKRPIVVLDGIVFKGDLKEIDPKTIESVYVLKGDKATPLWGSAGANGAVVITTKAVIRKIRPDTTKQNN